MHYLRAIRYSCLKYANIIILVSYILVWTKFFSTLLSYISLSLYCQIRWLLWMFHTNSIMRKKVTMLSISSNDFLIESGTSVSVIVEGVYIYIYIHNDLTLLILQKSFCYNVQHGLLNATKGFIVVRRKWLRISMKKIVNEITWSDMIYKRS